MRTRLDNKGYTEATITIQGVGADREIRVEIPEIDDVDSVMKIIGSSGELTFQNKDGRVYLTGSDVKKATAGYDKDGNPIWHCSSSIVNDITGISRGVFASSKKDAKKAVAYLLLCEHFQMQNQYGPNDFCPIWIYKDGKLIPDREPFNLDYKFH